MDITAVIGGVSFKNPVTISSGNVTRSINGIRRCVEAGAGAVVTKSSSFIPPDWPLPRPAIWVLDRYGEPGGSFNCEIGFLKPEEGARFVEEVKSITRREGAVLIASISLIGDLLCFSHEEVVEKRVC